MCGGHTHFSSPTQHFTAHHLNTHATKRHRGYARGGGGGGGWGGGKNEGYPIFLRSSSGRNWTENLGIFISLNTIIIIMLAFHLVLTPVNKGVHLSLQTVIFRSNHDLQPM